MNVDPVSGGRVGRDGDNLIDNQVGQPKGCFSAYEALG